ncbi:MAG: NAD(P)H-dependent oxidoreductase, partial [Thermoguttaceae bacterium]|nr:NAD(P)H-dependent oxidoreductase [Thermoguttaceae bacterium]
MKRRHFLSSFAAAAVACPLIGCAPCSRQDDDQPAGTNQTDKSAAGGTSNKSQVDYSQKKKLVIYFSLTGNTRHVAEHTAKLLGTEIFEIVPTVPYPTEYDVVVKQAKDEQDRDFRPEIVSLCDQLPDAEVVFLGSPCWWGTVAMPVMTFLERSDFAGKVIVPFMTHGGSKFGRTLADLDRFCPKATR